MAMTPPRHPRVVELFAGVGGFRLGLEGPPRTSSGTQRPRRGWRVVWHNQREPETGVQHALACYREHFGDEELTQEQARYAGTDIHKVMDAVEAGRFRVPDHELLVGGFPCQDYSVAKTQNQALGIVGVKGVLWWEIRRLLENKRPKYVFLENVDRLLKSPAGQRGRDFAVMLATLDYLGYEVEWRVVNAADYGFPQKRRRVLLVGRHARSEPRDPNDVLYDGTLAKAFRVKPGREFNLGDSLSIEGTPADLTAAFGERKGQSEFRRAGYMSHRRVWTADLAPAWTGKLQTLADVLLHADEVEPEYFLSDADMTQWKYLKGAKSPERTHRAGEKYNYSEGAIPFPDEADGAARTIVTGEGGRSPSRFKHVVRAGWQEGSTDTRLRRLTPVELERLNGFPDDWTDTGMPDGRRAFMMGNALVVGLVRRVGKELLAEYEAETVRD